MRLSIMFPDERTKPPTDSWENPVGEANTGLIGPDMGKSESTQQVFGGEILNVETFGNKRTFKFLKFKLHFESIEVDI